jgi:hypothetical protein
MDRYPTIYRLLYSLGLDVIAIKLDSCGLLYAPADVPTAHGLVYVAWKITKATFSLDVTIQKGT